MKLPYDTRSKNNWTHKLVLEEEQTKLLGGVSEMYLQHIMSSIVVLNITHATAKQLGSSAHKTWRLAHKLLLLACKILVSKKVQRQKDGREICANNCCCKLQEVTEDLYGKLQSCMWLL